MRQQERWILGLAVRAVIFAAAIALVGTLGLGQGQAQAQDDEPDCDNEALTAACEWGCTAAGGACEWGCGAGKDICYAGCTAAGELCDGLCQLGEGTCHFGCDFVFGVCHWWGFCDKKYHNCHNGCDFNCDKCQLDCKNKCNWDCSSCIWQCEQPCQFPCAQVGEACNPVDPGFGTACAAGLSCWPTFGILDDNVFTCFPDETDELFPDDVCMSFYVPALHEPAMYADLAMSYGLSASGAVGLQTTVEVGTVYGPDGCYGCYFTDCWGATSDVEAGLSACVGTYTSLDAFKGDSEVVVADAGDIVVFSLMEVFNVGQAEWLGQVSCLGLEASLAPVSIGLWECSTVLDVACCIGQSGTGECVEIANNPPTALCSQVSTCAGGDTCVAWASIDAGSFDPDGDSIYPSQSPPSPYTIGQRTATLSVSDPYGASDSCSAQVAVNDCTAPDIMCPDSTTAECESARQAVVDPGDALGSDCSAVTATDPGPASYPLGDTTVTYTATDAYNNSSSCDTTVSVVDTTVPEISCDAHDIVLPHTPISFTATADDICDEVTVEITAFDCFKFTEEGERIDKTESCVVEIDGDTINILDSGGLSTNITWTVVATDPSGNSSSADFTVRAIAYPDLKVADQYVEDPPPEIALSEDVRIVLDKVLHNDGPYGPIDAVTETVVTVPPGCTVSPSTHVQQFWNQPVSVDILHHEPFTIHCSVLGEHTFVFDDAVEITTADATDPDTSNDAARTVLTVAAVTQADVKITGIGFVNPPTKIPMAQNVDITLRKHIHNNGPWDPVDIAIEATAAAPTDCSVAAKSVPTSLSAVPVSVDQVVDEVWTINCTDDWPPLKTFRFDNSIEVATAYVYDSDPLNNSSGKWLTVRDPFYPYWGDDICDGQDNNGDTVIDEDWDLSENGIADCLDPALDSDGDTLTNDVDDDDDDDGWSDAAEGFMRTDPLNACPLDAYHDAFPPDINNDGTVNVLDIMRYRGPIHGVYDQRYDLNADGTVNVLDLMAYRPVFNTSCTSP